ncbi:hypothetical protein J6590_066636 [Homalodisca vitripennis]|nr:hypothetical protein J6590_066636 [Homalodisca vitripennis]
MYDLDDGMIFSTTSEIVACVLVSGQAKPKQPGGGGCKSRRARRITLFAPTAHSLSQYPLCVECEYECVLVVIWLFVVLYTVLWSVSCGSISVSELREWYK